MKQPRKSGKFIQMPEVDRLLGRVSPEPTTGCWLWTGAVRGNGYGHVWFRGKNDRAHRAVWTALGGSIPAGKLLLHSCVGMRSCVNPDHLRTGTYAENTLDAIRQGRFKWLPNMRAA